MFLMSWNNSKRFSRRSRPDGHVGSASEDAKPVSRLFSKEYDDLTKFRKQAGHKLNAIEKTLSGLLIEVDELSSALELAQEYSYSHNVKLVGVPSSNNEKVPMKHHSPVYKLLLPLE